MTIKRDSTFPDYLALDGPDSFSELIDSCTNFACKFLPALFPDAVSLFPVSGVLLFLLGKAGRSAEEERTEDGRRGKGSGCEQGMEESTESEAILLSSETGRRLSSVRLSWRVAARECGILG